MDISLTAIFCIESVLKIVAFGFLLNGSKSYMRNYWNILDFIIVVLTVRFQSSTYVGIILFIWEY